MRTSRSMSCTLPSVMRAWPRIVLTRRDRRSVRVEAIGRRSPRAAGRAKVHCRDDSIVRISVGLPGRPGGSRWPPWRPMCWRRFRGGPKGGGCRRRWWSAGCCTRCCWCSTSAVWAASAAARAWASRRCCRSPCGWCWRCTRWKAGSCRCPACAACWRCWARPRCCWPGRFPGEPQPLDGSPWAPLHWVLGIASYGLFGAAVLHAAMLDAAETRMRQHGGGPPRAMGMPLLQLERLTFRFVEAGFVVLTAALVLGALTLAAMALGLTRRCSRCSAGRSSPRCWPVASCGLARPARDALAVCRRAAAAAGLCRLALRHGVRAAAGRSIDLQGVKRSP